MELQNWIDKKLQEISLKLPSLVHQDPSSFSCGYNSGFKSALLELDRLLEDRQSQTETTIGKGELLFYNKKSSSIILEEIQKQLDLCENKDNTSCFRIDWKIIFGKKFGYSNESI